MSKIECIGTHYCKKDLERVGFFDDPNPSPFDAYFTKAEHPEGPTKSRQILPGPASPLFEKKFERVFEGEALTEPWRKEAQDRMEREKTKVAGTLLPPSGSKKHSSPGDSYGCFDKPTHFSPELRARQISKCERELPNMKTKPNPMGGPGYPDICLNPFPPYTPEPYAPDRGKYVPEKKFLSASAMMDYFPPNPYVEQHVDAPTYIRCQPPPSKMIPPGRLCVPFPKTQGGSHDGCFNKFPEYSHDPYIKEKEKPKPVKPLLSAAPPLRAKYTNSIVAQVTARSCNTKNYLQYQNKAYPVRRQST